MSHNQYYRLIEHELYNAKTKHPYFPEDLIHMVSIMNEEAGESIRAALNTVYHGDNIEKVKYELIQTGAMVIRCLENIEELQNEKIDLTKSHNQPCPECGAVPCSMDCAEGEGPGRSGSRDDGAGWADRQELSDESRRILRSDISDQGALLADK